MKPIIIDMKNMSESTAIYEKKPNPAIVGFIYIVLAITIISLIWMAVSDIDIVLESDGVICNIDNLSEVKCDYNSKITKCYVTDGQYVSEGDILFELEELSKNSSIKDDLETLQKTEEEISIKKAYNTFLNSDAKKISDLDSSELDAMKSNRFYEEYQTRKKLFINQLKELKGDKNAFSDKILSEKMSLYNDIQTLEDSAKELLDRVSPDKFEEGKLVIRANESGYFYASDNFKVGDKLDADSVIGNIYPDAQRSYQVQLIVFSSDIGKIHEGMEVKFEIDAYPSREYGTLTGRIRKISKKANYMQDQGFSYFPVWVDLDTSELIKKNGEITELKSGLMCKAKIVTGNESVLHYVLDAIR